ncbi:MAG: hypothetical protein R3E90_02545 [Marinicella sp.]
MLIKARHWLEHVRHVTDDGNSFNPVWPSLAGQHEAYLARQLKLFKKVNVLIP